VTVRSTWLSPRAVRLHATLVVVVGGCIALGWWQLSRALSGNGLSWVYTFEWPFFAAYATYMWWKLLHEPLSETRAPEAEASRERRDAQRLLAEQPLLERPREERVQEVGFDPYDETDPELAAYNRYLASLHQADASSERPARGRRAARS
jgi:DNA-binding transcriptional regulator of glucitol operon